MPMVVESLTYIDSNRDTHFTTGLAVNASEYEDLVIADTGDCRSWITSVRLWTATNHAFTVSFHSKSVSSTLALQRLAATPYADVDTIIDYVQFAAADAMSVATEYWYSMTGLKIPYRDDNRAGQLHVGLHNRDTVAKAALGATGPAGLAPGYVQLRVGIITAT